MESKIITVTLKRKEAQSQETRQKLSKSHIREVIRLRMAV